MESPSGLDDNMNEIFVQGAQAVEEAMVGYISHDPGVPEVLQESMLYSLRAGGKRLRPLMVLLACRACGGEQVRAIPAAAAVEMVHTYSLIHDDLPAMDNDDLRRGQPTNHKVFGEGIAILAGDALLTQAFNTLARHIQKDALARKLIVELSRAAGAAGLIGGQVADLTSQNSAGTLEQVSYIHTHKTALIFSASTRMGALCADAERKKVDLMGDFGLKLGLAFQITDDLLDITGSAEQLGKNTQKDHKAGKLTYPAVVGQQQARQQADNFVQNALDSIREFGAEAEPLRALARITNRRTS